MSPIEQEPLDQMGASERPQLPPLRVFRIMHTNVETGDELLSGPLGDYAIDNIEGHSLAFDQGILTVVRVYDDGPRWIQTMIRGYAAGTWLGFREVVEFRQSPNNPRTRIIAN